MSKLKPHVEIKTAIDMHGFIFDINGFIFDSRGFNFGILGLIFDILGATGHFEEGVCQN